MAPHFHPKLIPRKSLRLIIPVYTCMHKAHNDALVSRCTQMGHLHSWLNHSLTLLNTINSLEFLQKSKLTAHVDFYPMQFGSPFYPFGDKHYIHPYKLGDKSTLWTPTLYQILLHMLDYIESWFTRIGVHMISFFTMLATLNFCMVYMKRKPPLHASPLVSRHLRQYQFSCLFTSWAFS